MGGGLLWQWVENGCYKFSNGKTQGYNDNLRCDKTRVVLAVHKYKHYSMKTMVLKWFSSWKL